MGPAFNSDSEPAAVALLLLSLPLLAGHFALKLIIASGRRPPSQSHGQLGRPRARPSESANLSADCIMEEYRDYY